MKQFAFILFAVFQTQFLFAQYWTWGKKVTGNGFQDGADISLSPNNTLFVAGEYIDTAFYENDTLLPPFSYDAFYVLSLNSDGTKNWIKRWFGANDINALAVDADEYDNVYVAGAYDDSIYTAIDTFSTNNPAIPQWETYLIKLNPAGNELWLKQMQCTSPDSLFPSDIHYSNSSLFVSGFLTGDSVIFDSVILSGLYDPVKFYLVKYNSVSGALQWVITSKGNFEKYSRIFSDGTGNIYVTGNFSGTVIFGSDTVFSRGNTDIFIAKFDSSGAVVWLKGIGGSCTDFAGDITLFGDSEIYLSGHICDSVWFGNQLFTPGVASAMFLAKTNANSNVNWINFYKTGALAASSPRISLRIDGAGNVFTAASFTDTIFFPADTLASLGNEDGFLVKTDSAGNIQWLRQFGGDSSDVVKAIAVSATGASYLTGTFISSIDFDTMNLTGSSGEDAFIVKSDCYLIKPVISGDGNPFCEGDSAILSFTPVPWLSYLWNTGSSDSMLIADTSLPYTLLAYDTYGCSIASDTVFTNEIILPKPQILSIGLTAFCEGDSVQLYVNSIPGLAFQWSNGTIDTSVISDTAQTFYVTVLYSAILTNGDTLVCSKNSDTMQTVAFQNPPAIELQQQCDSLFANGTFVGYAWYADNSLIKSGLYPYLITEKDGNYYLIAYDSNSCSVYSDTITVFISQGIYKPGVFPNPAMEKVTIRSGFPPNTKIEFEVYTLYGQLMMRDFILTETGIKTGGCESSHNLVEFPVNFSAYESGVYILSIKMEDVKWTYKIVKI